MMTTHAKYSASGSYQWLKCPGSIGMRQLVNKLIEEGRAKQAPPSQAAQLGTAAHKLLEICLTQKLDAQEFFGYELEVDGETFIVDDNMADSVQMCVDYVNSLLEKYPDAELLLEQRIDVSSFIGPDMFGTADIVINIPFEKIIVIDYKHGQGVFVDIEGNAQLRYYALGVAINEDFDFDMIEMTIVQPRCPCKDGFGPIRTEEITVDELHKWAKELKIGYEKAKEAEEVIVKANKPLDEYLNAGSHCKFCPAIPLCPAMHEKIYIDAAMDFSDEDKTKLQPTKKPPNIDIDRIKLILDNGDMIKKYIDEVFSFAQNLLENGQEIPGYKLVKKRAYAKFKNDELDVIEKLVELGFDRDIITRVKLETLTKLKKICGKETVDSLTYIPDTGTTIVPITDKRPSIRPSAVSDFKNS